MDKFLQALASLLPTGFAWPRDPNSTLMKVMRGLAASFSEFHEFVAEAVRQWQPASTVNRLAEWEEACGLPDSCFGINQDEPLRRKLLLRRLRGSALAYDNSSPASLGAIEAQCLAIGYVATARYNTPFRCGVNRVGDRLGVLDGKLYLTVILQSQLFRVGVNRVGDRLLNGQLNGGELLCYLQRVLPSRYQLNVIFV